MKKGIRGFSLKLKLTVFLFAAILFITSFCFHFYRHITILPEDRLIFLLLLFGCFFTFAALFRTILKNREMRLARESSLKYELLFENTGAAIGIFDTNGKILALNKQNAKTLGGVPSDFIGKTLYDLFPESADFHLNRFKKIIEEKKGQSFEDEFPLPGGSKW